MNYQVRTFRGYYDTDSYHEATDKACDMIRSISHDGFGNDFWWAIIIRNSDNLKQFVSMPDDGLLTFTRFHNF